MTAPSDKELRVYRRAEEEIDFVVAYSAEDAIAIMRSELDASFDMEPGEWSVVKQPIAVTWDDGVKWVRTPEEWVAINGRGHLACSYA